MIWENAAEAPSEATSRVSVCHVADTTPGHDTPPSRVSPLGLALPLSSRFQSHVALVVLLVASGGVAVAYGYCVPRTPSWSSFPLKLAPAPVRSLRPCMHAPCILHIYALHTTVNHSKEKRFILRLETPDTVCEKFVSRCAVAVCTRVRRALSSSLRSKQLGARYPWSCSHHIAHGHKARKQICQVVRHHPADDRG